MDLKKIQNLVDFEIISINFVKRDNLFFLDVELPDKDLNSISEKSKIISDIIDQNDLTNENFYLNVFSSGTEKEIDINNLNLYLNEYVQTKLRRHILEKDVWEGYLLENQLSNIVLKINNKGKIQKLNIEKQDIEKIKTTAKLRKDK